MTDFPTSEIEFDSRFLKPKKCYAYLFKQKWADGFVCTKYNYQKYYLSSRHLL
jgi:hypothetical protein